MIVSWQVRSGMGGWRLVYHPSRYTYSGTPIEKTMHYVGQHMQTLAWMLSTTLGADRLIPM